jgi:C-terminal peptidase prc
MGEGASRNTEAATHRARRPTGRLLLLLVLIAVALACKATQGNRSAAQPTIAAATLPTSATLPLAPAQITLAPSQLAPTPSATATVAVIPASLTPNALTPTVMLPTATLAEPAQPTHTTTATLPPSLVLPTFQPVAVDPQTTAHQLAVFEEIWGVIRDRYLYPDFNGLDWNAIGQEYRALIQAGLSDADFYLAMSVMVERLGDEHSVYFSPEEAARRDQEFQGQTSFVGVGLSWTAVPERKRLSVVLVFPDSPAEAAGLRPHDSLLAVDGQPVVSDDGQVQNLLIGPEGSTIQLTVQSPGQEPRTVSITRRAITQQLPVPRQALQSAAGRRVGYIFIPTFNETNIDEEVGEALSELGNAGPLAGLIIDNRYNVGGASDVLLNTVSYFIDGPFGSFLENRSEIPLQVRGQNLLGSQSVPLVVLIGPRTVSFGEVFSGALQDLGRAHLIGAQTEGNVEVLSIFNFSDGSRAWIATSTFRPLRNPTQDWEQTGITPNQVVETPWDLVTFESDPAILAALQYFDTLPTP